MNPRAGPGSERLFSIFLDLVRIDSEPGGEGRVGTYVKEFLSSVGVEPVEDSAGEVNGGDCGNLIATLAGDAECPSIILNAHMDTVAPGRGVVPMDRGDRFSSDGTTVLGADCKAGVAAILACVEELARNGVRHRSLELVFTVQEEPGLIGAKNLDIEALSGEWGVVLDGSGPVGGIVLEAPSQERFVFRVRGRSAHAGVEPEAGNNAITCAAAAIATVPGGRIDEFTTANIGRISGGTAVNVVPDLAVVEGEVRSLSERRLEEVRSSIEEEFRASASRHGCELESDIERCFEHFRLSEDSTPVKALSSAVKGCGIEPVFTTSGGGSDANVFNAGGLEAAVVQIGLANAHSTEEYIMKQDLLALANILYALASEAPSVEGRSR
jgi:tripeptide aminopeptidase